MTHRRVLAGASTLSLSLSLLMLSPAPAHAEVLSGTHSVRVSVYPGTIGTTTCTLSAPRGSESSGPIAPDGVAVPRTTTTSLSVTDDNEPSNVTRLQATSSSTMTASQHAGQLSRLRMSVDTSASITTTVTGGNCLADIQALADLRIQFDLTRPSLVTLEVESQGLRGSVSAGLLTGSQSGANAYVNEGGGRSSVTTLLPAGAFYYGGAGFTLSLQRPATATAVTATGNALVDIRFDTPGSATGRQKGAGGRYVKLQGARDCASGAVTAKWKKAAGKGKKRVVQKATVLVNGTEVAKVERPKKKKLTSIAAAAGAEADVRMILQVKDKGRMVVRRSYRTCS